MNASVHNSQQQANNGPRGSRGLGDDPGIRVDAGIDTGSLRLQPQDRLLLTSDGVHGFLERGQLEAGLAGKPAPEAARWLVEEAMGSGSDDNVTALVISVDALAAGGPKDAFERWRDTLG